MPFCPSCRFECLSRVAVCPDCGAALVDVLPEAPRVPSEEDLEPVELCAIVGEIHAHLLQDRLLAEGIPSRLQSAGDFFGTPYILTQVPSNLIGGQLAEVRVMVNRRDLDRAKRVYEDFEATTQTPAAGQ